MYLVEQRGLGGIYSTRRIRRHRWVRSLVWDGWWVMHVPVRCHSTQTQQIYTLPHGDSVELWTLHWVRITYTLTPVYCVIFMAV